MYLSDGASRGFNCAEFEAESHLSGHSLWSLWFTNGCKTIVQEGIGYPEATSAKHGRSSTEFSGLHWGKRFHPFQSARSSPTWEATSPVDFFSVLIIFELAQLMNVLLPQFLSFPREAGNHTAAYSVITHDSACSSFLSMHLLCSTPTSWLEHIHSQQLAMLLLSGVYSGTDSLTWLCAVTWWLHEHGTTRDILGGVMLLIQVQFLSKVKHHTKPKK